MQPGYEDIHQFTKAMVEKIEEDFEKTFEEVNKAAENYHNARCVAREENKEECLNRFMNMFAGLMADELIKTKMEKDKKEIKGFGYIIGPPKGVLGL